jgi:5-(carboxyamino)imidazole ribonucleotide synthase
VRVCPSANAVSIAQNRLNEKHFFSQIGLSPVPYADVIQAEDITEEKIKHLLPGILKISRNGYDGKGQMTVSSLDEVYSAFESFGNVACVLEKRVEFVQEVSIIAARGLLGDCVFYPLSENIHRNGILDTSMVPARVSQAVVNQVNEAARQILTHLDYVGVLGIEFFVMKDQTIYVNEMAPRPHNSGHYTIDACPHSQFDQQVRALVGTTLAPAIQTQPVVMINLLGDLWPTLSHRWNHILAADNTKLYLYGKESPRTGRKMGHFTCMANTIEKALEQAVDIQNSIK